MHAWKQFEIFEVLYDGMDGLVYCLVGVVPPSPSNLITHITLTAYDE